MYYVKIMRPRTIHYYGGVLLDDTSAKWYEVLNKVRRLYDTREQDAVLNDISYHEICQSVQGRYGV